MINDRSEREMQYYRDNPEVLMPVLLPIRKLGGIVDWDKEDWNKSIQNNELLE